MNSTGRLGIFGPAMEKRNMLSVEDLTKTYGERTLFEGLTFGVQEGERVALVARNGSGKSTLLRAISGQEPADDGRVVFSSGVRHAHLRQDLELEAGATILDTLYIGDSPTVQAMRSYERALAEGHEGDDLQRAYDAMDAHEGWNFEARAREILGKLNLHDLQRPVGQLSGGEKRRVALAQVLLESPDFLILDEPTNHLDLDMIAWLEQRLASMGTTLLMVTHDRYFLENVCDRILELEDHTLHSYHGNFSYFLEKRAERRANAQAVQERARSHMKRELEWVRATPSARTTKSKSRLDRFQDLKKAAAKRLQEDPLHLTVIPERLGGKVVELHKVKRAFDERVLFEGLTHHFKRGRTHRAGGPERLRQIQLASTHLGVGGTRCRKGGGRRNGGVWALQPRRWTIQPRLEVDRCCAGHRRLDPVERWRQTHGSPIAGAIPLPPCHASPAHSVAERRRAQAPSLAQGAHAQPQFLGDGRAHQRLGHFHAVRAGGILDGLLWLSGRRFARQVFHGQARGPRLGGRRRRGHLHSRLPRQLQPIPRGTCRVAETCPSRKGGHRCGGQAADAPVEVRGDYSQRLSYKEKLEFEALDKAIPKLEARRNELSTALQGEQDLDTLTRLGEELGQVAEELEEAEMRWLELSERS